MPVQMNPSIAPVERMMRDLLGDGPVARAALYHLEGGGSRARAILALDAAASLGLDFAAAASCACSAELLHNASLVHDDLQERDATRRGRPALWREFGAATAICTGDLMISAAFASLAAHPDPHRALTIMHEAVAKTAHGQVDDADARAISLEDYRILVEAKTGPLLALPVRLALCAARASGDEVAAEIGRRLSLAYQVLDDLTDVDADRAAARINICVLLEASGHSSLSATAIASDEARGSLQTARRLASRLPHNAGISFCNLADRLENAVTEFADAA